LQVKKDGASDVVRLKSIDDVGIEAILEHPCGNFTGCPGADLCGVEMRNGGSDVVVLSLRDDGVGGSFSERGLEVQWGVFGQQWG
jgi:hypothetical protein